MISPGGPKSGENLLIEVITISRDALKSWPK